ncbi:MAG: helix-turn-helix domain-containing protein [Acetobacteraceae bacterium]
MTPARTRLRQIEAWPLRHDWAVAGATTEAATRRRAIADSQDPDGEPHDGDVVSPRFVRRGIGLSRTGFAAALRIPVATLRNWERHRVAMDPATIALMTILAHKPEAALRGRTG